MPGLWRQVSIAGKSADVFQPVDPSGPGAVVFLHGHGLITLAGNAAYSRLFDQHGLRVVCPHGQRSWWLDRVCAEFDPQITPERYVLNEVLPWVELNWNIRPPQVALFGVSMGGQGVLRIAYRDGRRIPVVAALSPLVDIQQWYGHGLPLDEMYGSAEEARQETATLQIHPLNWPRHQYLACDPADKQGIETLVRLTSKLSSSGIPYEGDTATSHGGHSWEYFNRMADKVVPWLAESLRYESLRE